MSKLIILLPFILIACEPTTREELLIGNPWTIMTVENLTTGEFVPDEIIRGTLWFNKNNTFVLDSKGGLFPSTDEGNWTVSNDTVVVMESNDTTEFKIEKLTDKDFVCLVFSDDTFRYTFRRIEGN